MVRKKISRTVWFLGFASFFSDVASEAIYPLLPLFLTTTLHANFRFIGLFEGVAESTASLVKGISGYASDRVKRPKLLVLCGYFLANITRPFLAFVSTPFQALVLRFTDRIGKGIRTAPRDSWLSKETTSENRGLVFGFHRAMDHAGAVVGPLIATLFLYFFPGKFRTLFLWTAIPGVISVAFILLAGAIGKRNIEDIKPSFVTPEPKKPLPTSFRWFLVVLFVFTLGSSSDAFLLLKIKEMGISEFWIPSAWAGLHVVRSSLSTFGGRLSDRIGRYRTLRLGWLVYIACYVVFGLTQSVTFFLFIFFVYGLHAALTEGVEKALVADLVPEIERGSAFGLLHLTLGVGALPASWIAGEFAQRYSLNSVFLLGAGLGLAGLILFQIWLKLHGNPATAK